MVKPLCDNSDCYFKAFAHKVIPASAVVSAIFCVTICGVAAPPQACVRICGYWHQDRGRREEGWQGQRARGFSRSTWQAGSRLSCICLHLQMRSDTPGRPARLTPQAPRKALILGTKVNPRRTHESQETSPISGCAHTFVTLFRWKLMLFCLPPRSLSARTRSR
jgi:hypothetical protein